MLVIGVRTEQLSIWCQAIMTMMLKIGDGLWIVEQVIVVVVVDVVDVIVVAAVAFVDTVRVVLKKIFYNSMKSYLVCQQLRHSIHTRPN